MSQVGFKPVFEECEATAGLTAQPPWLDKKVQKNVNVFLQLQHLNNFVLFSTKGR